MPVDEAVNIALSLEHKKDLNFALTLIDRLGHAAAEIAHVGGALVDELSKHFGWQHVSLFRVDGDEKTLSIVHQAGRADCRLADGYTQSTSDGLLGHVSRSGKAVRENKVDDCDAYLEGIPSTRSEMCLPVPGDRVRWILNVESTLENAFAPEEQAAVERLLEVAGLILDRTLAIEFNSTVLESVADAVIQTTSCGRIQNVNPACEKLLDLSRDALVGMDLSALVSAPGNKPNEASFAKHLIDEERIEPSEVEFIPKDRVPIPVLLSGASLPPQIGGKVYVASDLRFRREVQRMDSLKRVFQQVASETRLPLTLAASYLDDLRQEPSLPEVIQKLVRDLPESHRRMVIVAIEPQSRPALTSQREFEFCASSVLAFLMRMKAQRDEIRVRITPEQSSQVMAFELLEKDTLSPSPTRLEAKSDNEREFSLAESVIQNLMHRMRGSLQVIQRDGLSLKLALDAAEST